MFTCASTTTLHTGQMLLVYSMNTSPESRLPPGPAVISTTSTFPRRSRLVAAHQPRPCQRSRTVSSTTHSSAADRPCAAAAVTAEELRRRLLDRQRPGRVCVGGLRETAGAHPGLHR